MATNEYIPTLTHATERDIDLLLVEEIYSNRNFLEWLTNLAGININIESWQVKHSQRRTQSRREMDIFIDIRADGNRKIALLIENKLDASEQPDQAESYRDELANLSSKYHQSRMIIVCPEGYKQKNFEFVSKFDVFLSYEKISAWYLQAQKKASADVYLRFKLRSELFDQAVNKYRRGYTAIPNKVIGTFNAQYVSLLREMAPEIIPGNSMLQKANPNDSSSMIFDQDRTLSFLPLELRPRRFAHELGRGLDYRANYVAVVFPGWGLAYPQMKDQLVEDTVTIGALFYAGRPNKNRPYPGLRMYFPTEPVDSLKGFEEQREAIVDGINEAKVLRKWLQQNQAVLQRWKSVCEKIIGLHK
jgi:hypothetical protein